MIKPIVMTSYTSQLQSGAAMHQFGRIAARLDTARALLMSALGVLDEIAISKREFALPERARHKGLCAHITDLLHQSVEEMMFLAGSSAFSARRPLSRFWKDIHVAFRHIMNVPAIGYEVYGRARLNVDNISPPDAI